MPAVIVCGDQGSNDVLEVGRGPLAPSNPPVPLPSTMGCWPPRWSCTPLSGSNFDSNLYVVGERTHRSAVEAADKDLFTAFQVHAPRRFLARDDVCVGATLEAARQDQSVVLGEVPGNRPEGPDTAPRRSTHHLKLDLPLRSALDSPASGPAPNR